MYIEYYQYNWLFFLCPWSTVLSPISSSWNINQNWFNLCSLFRKQWLNCIILIIRFKFFSCLIIYQTVSKTSTDFSCNSKCETIVWLFQGIDGNTGINYTYRAIQKTPHCHKSVMNK